MKNYDTVLTIEQLRLQDQLYQQLKQAESLDQAYLAVEKLGYLPANGCVPQLRMIKAVNIVSGTEFFPYIWTLISRRYPMPHWWEQAYALVEVSDSELTFMKRRFVDNLTPDKYLVATNEFFESDACQDVLEQWRQQREE